MPSTTLRKTRIASARSAVVKMGTQLLTGADGHLDLAFLRQIAGQIAALRRRGMQVTVVSSGAIGAGMAQLGLTARPRDVAELQAVAAVGQPLLMRNLREAFEPFELPVAQLLLTRGDFDDRGRFLNIRNCISVLHRLGCVPIVNENDTVAVEEIRLGDNDTLAALLCNALRAEVLVLLSVVDGLLDDRGRRIDLVNDAVAAAGFIRPDKSARGTGGMVTKHTAASLVTGAGEMAVIADGRQPDVLGRLFAGEAVGTVFAPVGKPLDSRRRWIGLTRRPAGTLVVDAGAVTALREQGRSLLASGITAVEGEFGEGEVLRVCDPQGDEVARGLGNYGSEELRRIMGQKSGHFEQILGRPAYAEVIHRNNLVLSFRGHEA